MKQRLADAYIEACEIELAALKPGNVGAHAAGHRMQAQDFRLSARLSASALTRPGWSLGEAVYWAVRDTRCAVACNTNLGIVLLCAPLLHAARADAAGADLRTRLRQVLDKTDRDDARWVYRAIRLAAPAGLGTSEVHDVRGEPDCDLLTAMRSAADRDRIAFQYSSGFADIFEYAAPRLARFEARWHSETWAATAVYLGLLRRYADSHVARKFGTATARAVTATAARLDDALCRTGRPEAFTEQLLDADTEFKRAGINPGTTADLTVATLLAVRLERMLAESAPARAGPAQRLSIGA